MKQKIYIAGIILFATIVLISSFVLCCQSFEEQKIKEAYETLAQFVGEDSPTILAKNTLNPLETPAQTAFDKYTELYAHNSDFIGWIRINGTDINYPVMQTKDRPDYYLKRSFDKAYSDYGVPYVAENCDVDISDNTVIYGHHMHNGTMFSDLMGYTSQSFYEEHRMIQFDTLGGFGEYEVIAALKTTAYTESGFKYYQFTSASSQAEFDDYVATCKTLALYDTGVTAEYGDLLITLSTCEYSQQDGRFLVVAKKITG